MKNKSIFNGALFFFLSSSLFADQPIMNMMPRWDDGWGVQVIEEYRYENDLLLGKKKIASGFSEDVHITHLEAVYTWDRAIRVTAKLPYVIDAKRELPNGFGGKRTEHNSGFGDMTLALILKDYFNLQTSPYRASRST